ncbi:MAG TPA: hypothetical protein VMV98_05115, partial [Acidobacteriaceae bacterium]|nr:hypothetical protein [Acidobacteriaceae bacterium]
MTIRMETRALARHLLIYESEADKSSEPGASPILLVYEKLRQSLTVFAGVSAFESLAFRALTQAKSEAPDLWPVQIAADGSLQGLGEFEPQIDRDKDLTGAFPADDGGIALIARLLSLLHIFLGESLTASLLRVTWPGA